MDRPPTSPYFLSNQETENMARISRLILGPCTDILRDILIKEISPSDLSQKVRTLITNTPKTIPRISNFHEELVYGEDYSKFDITLLYFLLRRVCSITPHKNGWGNVPNPEDRSPAASIERIRMIRNESLAHISRFSLSNSEFHKKWEYISEVLHNLERYLGTSTAYQETQKEYLTCLIAPTEAKTYILRLTSGVLEIQDIPSKKYEQITSETLKELFNSFKVDFPADVPGCKSFARTILEDDINRLVTAIHSLSSGIVLTTEINAIKRDTPQVEACMFEVDVVYDGDGDGDEDQLCVFRKKTSLNMLFEMEEDTRVRVILIRSESLPVVSSKLIVYKSFKHVINEKGFFLQHEYEEIDAVAKMIAYRVILSFCSSVESLTNAFTADLRRSMADYFDKPLTADKIRLICSDVLENTGYKPFGSTKSTRNWSSEVADFIQSKLSNEKLKGADAWSDIKSACCKTVEDLKIISNGLDKFQANELQIDQKKEIAEWHKSEVIRDKSLLHNNQSIINYIAGYKDNGEQVVKVYLSDDNEQTKQYFIDCCDVSKDTRFEFVNVERSNEKMEKQQIKLRERKPSAINNSTRKQLKKIIQEYGEEIYAKHSNVVGIRIGEVKQKPCIILYCLDKYIIPFGEKPLPESIAGWPCDVREDFVRFGICPNACPAPTQNLPDPGCSVGIQSDDSSGSVGFLVESKNSTNAFGFGFLTASHVAVKCFEKLYHDKQLLSMHYLRLNANFVVHPSFIENGRNNHTVGQVVESFIGNYGLFKKGLDFALIRSNFKRNGGKEILTVAKEDEMNFDTNIVTKTGKSTGTTYGYLVDNSLTVKVDRSFLSRGYFAFFNCYAVEDSDGPFFLAGDSGSGVYVMENGNPSKPLGIAFAFFKSQTAVCNIGMIVDKLGLQIVRYLGNKDESMSLKKLQISEEKTEEKSDEHMDMS